MEELTVLNATAIQAQPQLDYSLYQQFIDYIEATPKTVATYTRALRQFFVWLNMNGIKAPVRKDVLDYKAYLIEHTEIDDATGEAHVVRHKPTTTQAYITAVRVFFSWAATQGLYPNIADHVKGAKISKEHKKDYLTSAQMKSVLDRIDRSTDKGKRDYAIVSLMATSALRTIEVQRANIEDLRTVADNTVLFIQGKGKEERTDYVKVAPEVEQAIREYLKTRPDAQPTDALFTSTSRNNYGERMTTRSISDICKERMVNAGYNSERLTAHSLRHTGVTLALLNGADLQETQEYARHSNLATTMIYAHNLDKAKNTCGARVAGAIFG